MEVALTYEREEEMEMEMEMEMGMGMEQKPISPTTSDGSCISTESSPDVYNIHFFDNTNTNTNITSTTSGPQLLEAEAEVEVEVLAQVTVTDDKNLNFEDINVFQNQGTKGFSLHHNGSSSDTNGGVKETDVRSHSSTFSNTPTTPVGLKYVETLLDESCSGVIPTHTFNAQESEPRVEEYDVEKVIQKQETHDLYCPNCRSCITKRVILRRRKRKIQEISTAEESSESGLDQGGSPAVSDILEEDSQQPSQIGGPPGSRLDAISCFSCFSIFVPSGEGFLCWRFKPKVDATRLKDDTSISIVQAEDSKTDSSGTIFPLWIVTCCQPAERRKLDETAATLGSIYRPTSEDDTKASPRQTAPSLPLSDDMPVASTPGILLPEHSTSEGRPLTESPQHDLGATLQSKPLVTIIPYGDAPSSETPSYITTDEGSKFPLWILTCCQPSMAGKKLDDTSKLDGTAPLQESPPEIFGDMKAGHPVTTDGCTLPRENPSKSSGGTESDHLAKSDTTVPQKETPSEPIGGTRRPTAPSDDVADRPATPFKPESPAIFVPGTSSSSKPKNPVVPNNDTPLPPQTESPAAPGGAVLPMPHKPQPPVIPSETYGSESLVDVEPGLARERPRPGVSGLDVIKAMVYGGLLESITSLSVITSAAGGDATTLNIVALGLANVFGGLVVLVHNLRVLKHEHTTEHYEAQLGRPGHYMLHAIVAITSYLIFGLLSPIIYGFSFRKSDNKDYKLATLAAAALACITLLSAAKAYVRNAPKGYLKIVFYYISLGFMVSGLGYVAGDVINMLLKKFGIFDPRAPDNVPVLAAAAGVMNVAWSSY